MKTIVLTQTCYACPEQYDAELDGETVGYLRLRHGRFYVECPYVGGTRVHEVRLDDASGIFSDEERMGHLQDAAEAIFRHMFPGQPVEVMIKIEGMEDPNGWAWNESLED